MKTKAVTLAAFVFIVAASITRSTFFPEGDIFWGARNGIETLQHGIQPFQPDSWNLQTLGEEWSPNSWLWNVLLGVAYQLFGNYGFLLLTLVTNVAAYGFIWGYLQRLKIAPLAAFFIIVGCWSVMDVFMTGRSNTVDVLLLAIFLYLSHRLRDKMLPLLVMCFLLTVLWMNLHLTGVAAAVVFPAIVYAILHKERFGQRLKMAAATLGVVLPAFLLTPFGFAGLLKVSLVENASKDFILEWSNVFAYPEANIGIMTLLCVSIVACLVIFKNKQFLYGFGTVALIYGTYDTIRIAPFLLTIILGALVFTEGKSLPVPKWLEDSRELAKNLLLILVFGVVAVVGVISVMDLTRVIAKDDSMFLLQDETLALIPLNARVASDPSEGSALILFRPDVLVSLDGRNDLLGIDRYYEASNILYSNDPAETKSWLDEHNIDTVLIGSTKADGAERIQANMEKLDWVKKPNGTDAIVYVSRK